MNDSIKLKPCPFCGGEAELFEERIYFVPFRNLPWKGVRCIRCGGRYISTDINTRPNDMRDAWNRRATDDGKQHKASTPN